ncbi:putative metalloprotease CJM1_0395 family protein [Halioxenophilus sp. WMMB6]|uniref:putative metalloprotease CJM1_0395 family protein n=1 Tax=Halioxenophilus sp. WMMB6 TaxID=3073815 RepID=UPI00295E4FE5|nr:putative metalloprotease CJM1_0395 family protein [Halioxenophilus sp. WMMB6]
MNTGSINTSFVNVVTPFSSGVREDIANPLRSAPLPPIQQAETVDRTSNRVERRTTPASRVEQDAGEVDESSTPEAVQFAQPEGFSAALSEQELATLQKLKLVDQSVRDHEQAHQSVAGQFAGSANFDFDTGPDGNRYAVAGEVPIRLPVGDGDPQQRLRQADQVIRAALAPVDPSSQDRSIAARAVQIKNDAKSDLREEQRGASSAAEGAGQNRLNPAALAYPALVAAEAAQQPGQTVATQV